jgi:hypothetical protein
VTATNGALFNDHLMERYKASVAATPEQRKDVVARVMTEARLPREGISGAANAYVLFVSDEFGDADPPWSPDEIDKDGWTDLWRLRIGKRNPHFLPERALFMTRRPLWRNLYGCLPDAFKDREVAYTMCAWANLSEKKATTATKRASLTDGMHRHVGPLIIASQARVVLATKKEAWHEVNRWALAAGGSHVNVAGIQAVRMTIDSRVVFAAYVGGHPSHFNQFMTSAEFVQRLSAFIAASEKVAR